MAKTEKEEKKKNVINLEDFFSTTKESEGIWIDPLGMGVEFKILGASSDVNAISAEEYSKAEDEANKVDDIVRQRNLKRDAICKRIASMVIDIRAKDGNEIMFGGEPVKFSKELITKFCYENVELRTALLNAIFDSTNFMKKKY